MAKIKAELGDYIAGAVEGTPIPPAFVAGLVANESGGVANAIRFEPQVFAEISKVCVEQAHSYTPAGVKRALGPQDFIARIAPVRAVASNGPALPVMSFAQSLLMLVNYATSWGPTQIMGWHAIEFDFPLGELSELSAHFEHTVQLLEWFASKYSLDWTNTLTPALMFKCWNTGNPHATTFDPAYVSNGVRRMGLYGAAS
jgi:hypothetical protein